MAVVGLGNIGGFSAALLARLAELQRLILVDRDVYDASNISSQDILPTDVGAEKALVQADRLRQIAPRLQIEAHVGDVEHLPLGRLRASVLVACLDSRRARQVVNQIAWRLGIPWVDAGVHADACLARVNVYVPGPERACLECSFSDSDYAAIEQTYPCLGDAPAPRASHAPASLGALAAALQVLECRKLLSGQWERALIDKQVVVDAASHRHFVTSFRRRAACRFDHATWAIDTLAQQPGELTVGDLFSLPSRAGAAPAAGLRVEGQVFVKQLTCPSCGDLRPLFWRLSGRLGAAQQCERCRRRMLAAGFDVAEWLHPADLPAGSLERPLCDLGFCAADVATVRAGDVERHFQLGTASLHVHLPDPSPTLPGRGGITVRANRGETA